MPSGFRKRARCLFRYVPVSGREAAPFSRPNGALPTTAPRFVCIRGRTVHGAVRTNSTDMSGCSSPRPFRIPYDFNVTVYPFDIDLFFCVCQGPLRYRHSTVSTYARKATRMGRNPKNARRSPNSPPPRARLSARARIERSHLRCPLRRRGELQKARRGIKRGNKNVFFTISGDAFITISWVAAELDVPEHVVRFWGSKFFQVRPLRRGTGRLYYPPEDVILLQLIHDLLYFEGSTVRGVQHALRKTREKSVIEPERPPKEKCEIIQWNGGSHGTAPAEAPRVSRDREKAPPLET